MSSQNDQTIDVRMTLCLFCMEPKGVAIGQRLITKEQADKQGKYCMADYDPCDTCQAEMDKGITLVAVEPVPLREDMPPFCEDGNGNPLYPTGAWCVVTEDGYKDMATKANPPIPPDIVTRVLEHRLMTVPREALDMLGKNMIENIGGAAEDK